LHILALLELGESDIRHSFIIPGKYFLMNTTQPELAPFLPQQIRTVFLDRDGVINRKPREGEYIGHWSDFHLLAGAAGAIAALHRSGRRILVVSNQRGVALGLYTEADVNDLHRALEQHLAAYGAYIDGFYFCPHDRNQCDCRKPGIRLFENAFYDFPDASRNNSLMIGDSLSDIQAARNLGIPSIFIQGDPETQKPGAADAAALASAVARSLREAVEKYLP
jgi:D-glycero-D-manno-heptose 1,7-bisphosphate phosphatase